MLSRQRLQTPDLLKGMAVIFMIQVHIMELFTMQEIMDGPVGKASLFLGGVPAAPVFMILMGYFLAFGRKSSSALMIRGLKLFIAGMFLNVALNAHLLYNVLADDWGDSINIWQYIFGVDILHLAGLSLLVLSVVIPLFKDRLLPYLILISLVLLIPFLISPYDGEKSILAYIMAFIYSKAEWSYFPLLPWLVYPVTGYTVFLLKKRYPMNGLKRSHRAVILLLIPVFIAITFPYAAGIMHHLKEYYHHNAVFFLWTMVFLIWWWTGTEVLEHYLGDTVPMKYIKWLGIHVTTIYFFQWIIIGNIATGVFKTLPLHSAAVWFILILIFTSAIAFVWNKIITKHQLNFLIL